MSDPAQGRWLAMVLSRIAGAAGAVLGVLLLARSQDTPTQALGVLLVLAALYFMAVVPRALAARWRTPPADKPE